MIYQIKHDLRIKLDQVELPADYQPWSVTSVYNLNCQNFQDFDLDLTTMTLTCHSKLTDIASQVFCSNGLLISNLVYDILISSKLPTYRAFPVKIVNKEGLHNYHLLFVCFDLFEYVEFEESQFFIENQLREKSQVRLRNRREYLALVDQHQKDLNREKSDEMDASGFPRIGSLTKMTRLKRDSIHRIGFDQLKLKNGILDNFDLIYNAGKFYISKKLKDEFELMKFSGFILETQHRIES